MSLTVGEVLENAQHNLASTGSIAAIQHQIGRQQMDNYQKAKSAGAEDDDDWYEWEEKLAEEEQG